MTDNRRDFKEKCLLGRALDYDKAHPVGVSKFYPGGGGYAAQAYNVAYTKAMMQAVAST